MLMFANAAHALSRPFVFDIANPINGSVINCDFRFGRWEKNWMPFSHEGRLLAIRWFSPHSVIEVFPETGRCTELYSTQHPFAGALEIHGGPPPVRFDRDHYLALVRFRTGSWVRSGHETRHYVNLFYLFEARPPFAVVRLSSAFTLPSCLQQRLNMRIQVVKSLVQVPGGFVVCWGELDCYSCCAYLPIEHVHHMLQLKA